MMTIVMMFIFPIGMALYYFERKDRPRYRAVFETFFDEVQANPTLPPKEKIDHVKKMMLLNGYHITAKSDTAITAERKIMSMGVLAMSLGFFYVGAALYLIYFYYIQKPHVVTFTV